MALTLRGRQGQEPVTIEIPDFCLLAVLGPTPAEGTAFVQRHFAADDPITAGREGWHDAVGERLAARKLTVVEAKAVLPHRPSELLGLAKHNHAQPVAILFVTDKSRSVRDIKRKLEMNGFRTVHLVRDRDEAELNIRRIPLAVDRRTELGPFDIIGDVHGCADELELLLGKLGYGVRIEGSGEQRRAEVTGPQGRRAIFVGDFVDRGPRSPDVMRIVMAMHAAGIGLSVPGNHDAKFLRWLQGRNVTLNHGLERTAEQFSCEGPQFRAAVSDFIAGLRSHMWLDEGRLVVAHAGIPEDMIGRETGAVREFCLYGDTDGDKDEAGLALRYHWAARYRGPVSVVYGHTPVLEADWVNNTLCIDTGCCFGGALTALRWPEREIVSVAALQEYARRGRPFGHPPSRPRESDAQAD
jgi:protein phosphatase